MKRMVNGAWLYPWLMIGFIGHCIVLLLSIPFKNDLFFVIQAVLAVAYAVALTLFCTIWEGHIYWRDKKQKTL